MSGPSWTVSEVARMARVTVRTLHHYDDLGLLEPAERSDAGYRLYGRPELERLQEILLYRAAEVPLEEIGALLEADRTARARALQAHRARLERKREHLDELLRTVDRTLLTLTGEETMTEDEMFEGFEELADAPEEVRKHHRTHASETHRRWGETDAWAEAGRRTRSYGTEKWNRITREAEALEARMAALLEGGSPADGPEAMDGAEAMRLHIDRWYYPCGPRMHAGLAEMYEGDPRFRARYDDRVEGLADFVAAAIRANAERSV